MHAWHLSGSQASQDAHAAPAARRVTGRLACLGILAATMQRARIRGGTELR